jgi:phage baseplate assembly protein W
MPTDLTTLPGLDPYDQSLLLQDGDLAFEYNADGLRELQMIAGIENLAQGLTITVETPLGSDIFNQLFGFDLYSILRGGYNLAMTKQLIRLHVVKTISSDDRVLRIEELVFDDEPRFAELNPGADPAEAKRLRKVTRHWRLDGVIQPVTGEPTVVPIEVTGV